MGEAGSGLSEQGGQGGPALVARRGWRIPFAIVLLVGPFALFGAAFTFIGPMLPLGKEGRDIGWLIWVSTPLTGLIAGLALHRLLYRPVLLRVGARGLMWSAFSGQTIPWDNVREVSVMKLRGQRVICVELVDPSAYQRSEAAYSPADGANRLSGLGDLTISAAGTDRGVRQIMSAIRRHGGPRVFGR